MPKVCVVGQCQSQPEKNKTSVFQFPAEKRIKRRWIKYVRENRKIPSKQGKNKKWEPGEAAYICSLHFDESQFKGGKKALDNYLNAKTTKVFLTKDAVPNIKYQIPKVDTSERSSECEVFSDDSDINLTDDLSEVSF